MIITEWVEVSWGSSNRAHYESKGYVFTKKRDTFKCKPEDLTRFCSIKFKVKCMECERIFSRDLNTYLTSIEKYNKYICTGCITAQRNKKQSHNIEYVYEKFNKAGLIPKFSNYTHNKERLPCVCKAHSNTIIYKSLSNVLSMIKQGLIGCNTCTKEAALMRSRIPFSEIRLYYERFNVTLLSDVLEYRNLNSTLRFICNNHPHKEQSMKINAARGAKNICYFCAKEAFKGPNHPNYQPNTSIDKHLRLVLDKWKKEQFIRTNGRCELSGEGRDLEVHHLVLVNKLRDASVKEAGIVNNPKTRIELSTEELEKVSHIFLNKHYENNLGVVICKRLHKLFHKLYGNRSCDELDFYEFKERYLKGEFT